MQAFMNYRDEIDHFIEIAEKCKSDEPETITETDVLRAMVILNFIDYKKIADVFLGRASVTLLSTYASKNRDNLGFYFRAHINDILKGIEDINLPTDIRVSYDRKDHGGFLILDFRGFQFSFMNQKETALIRRISRYHEQWDGIRKKPCIVTIFNMAYQSQYLTNQTLNHSDLRTMVEKQLAIYQKGGIQFKEGKIYKTSDITPGKDLDDDYLRNYIRQKLFACGDRPVIVSGIFKRIWDKHVTFTSIKPYIPGIRVMPICDHINLYRPDVEKAIDIDSLVYGARYYIIGYCEEYSQSQRMGINLALDITDKPIFSIKEFNQMPPEIFSECYRFSIEEYISAQQKSYRLR
jgi:hypothetical protein